MAHEFDVDANVLAERNRLVRFVHSLAGSGRWSVTFKKQRGQRTVQQNRYYFKKVVGALTDIQVEQGQTNADGNLWTKDDSHDELRRRHLPMRELVVRSPMTGEVSREMVPGHTPALDTVEFWDYVDRCVAWLQDFFGEVVEPPDPSLRVTPLTAAERQRLGVE